MGRVQTRYELYTTIIILLLKNDKFSVKSFFNLLTSLCRNLLWNEKVKICVHNAVYFLYKPLTCIKHSLVALVRKDITCYCKAGVSRHKETRISITTFIKLILWKKLLLWRLLSYSFEQYIYTLFFRTLLVLINFRFTFAFCELPLLLYKAALNFLPL